MFDRLSDAAHELRTIVDDARQTAGGGFVDTVRYTAGGIGLATYSAISDARHRREAGLEAGVAVPSGDPEIYATAEAGEATPPVAEE